MMMKYSIVFFAAEGLLESFGLRFFVGFFCRHSCGFMSQLSSQ